MDYLLVLILTPAAIWLIDRVFFRGDFTGALVGTLGLSRAFRGKARRPRRS